MRIYILPTSERGMGDKLFEHPAPYDGGLWNLPFLSGLRDAARSMGIEVHTTDAWSKATSRPDDILVVQNHPGETLLWRAFYYAKYFRTKGGFVLSRRRFVYDNYRFFKRRVLVQGESPMVMPYVYRDLPCIKHRGIYETIMLVARGYGTGFEYYNPYVYRDREITSPLFNVPKDKFLTLINSNARPHSFVHELYGERLNAIRYFSAIPGFDLYGHGWDKMPRHPLYLHYGTYVRAAWRGTVKDKLKTMSRYAFAICYENAAFDGYASEKLFDALAVGTIPIYLGAPDIETLVPSDCFIDLRKFKDYAALHAFLASLTEDAREGYRQNILRFLRDGSTMMGMQALVRRIVG